MGISERDQHWMQCAYEQAVKAKAGGEVPVGAVIVEADELVATGFNQPIESCDPSAHAEIVALRKAALKKQNYRLLNTTLYVTLEPCAMCIGAILHARVNRLVFGAYDKRAGALESVFQIANEPRLNHRLYWQGGVMADQCGALLTQFFKERR